MIYAHVVGGYIVNRILWDGVGDPPINSGELIPADQAAGLPSPPAPELPVPEEVDSLAFELTLHGMGLHAAVMNYIDTLTEIEKIYWRRRPTMRRDSTLIEAGRVALGLTHAQVDALFIGASQVVA